MPDEFQSSFIEKLDVLGGEPLEGSGFEDEQPEDGFEDGGDDGNN